MHQRTGAKDEARPRQWVHSYRPENLTAVEWVAVRPFVADCAHRLGLDGGAASLRAVRVLARLAAWVLSQALPLDVEVVLDPDTVESFIATAGGLARSRATYRSELRRLGPLLTRFAPGKLGPKQYLVARLRHRTRPENLGNCERVPQFSRPRDGYGPPSRCWPSVQGPAWTGDG
jgi:hypothetical protein